MSSNRAEDAWDMVRHCDGLTKERFDKWLYGRARSLFRRDGTRQGGGGVSEYRQGIIDAICAMKDPDLDEYTGTKMDWSFVGTFNNEEARKAKENGENYKAKFRAMPTVDHRNSLSEPDFVICSWLTNDAKNDLPLNEFIEFCQVFLRNQGYSVTGK